MRKMMVIAVREYLAAVKTKAFLITVLAMPILMGGSIAVQLLVKDKVDIRDKRVAVLDHTGQIYEAIAAAADERNKTDIFKGEGAARKQNKPRFLIEQAHVRSDDQDARTLELSERVRDREDPLFAFVIIGEDAIAPGEDSVDARVRYHSNSPAYDGFRGWVSGVVNSRIHGLRLAAANLDPEVVAEAMAYVPVASLGLVSTDETGQISDAEETNEIATFLVPLGMMMLMFMVIMVGASPLTNSVLEEKMHRIAEVLLGSVTPFQLMSGKLLGTVGVSMTLATLYLVGASIALHRSGFGSLFPAELVWWFVIFLCLSVLLYGSMFISVGAAVTDLKEAQSLMMPLMIVVMAPMFVWTMVIKEPTATFSVVASLVPTATPMLMLVRQAVPPGVPLWQPLLGIALVLITTIGCVFVAGRIFRVGILMQGKGANIAQILQWVIRG